MKRIDETKYNWGAIQKDFDDGLTLSKILRKYGISRTVFNRGRKIGLFITTRNPLSHKHSSETKNKISKKRIEYLKKDVKNHNWSKYHKKSIPCSLFKEKLLENGINFIEEYRPLDKNFYKIDIAFPDKKIGIEINGNQHYNLDHKTLKPYYQKRKNIIESTGWKLFDFHYTISFKKEKLDEIVAYLIANKIGNLSYFEDDWKVSKKFKNKKRLKRLASDKINKIDNIKKLLLESDIDFSKFGWVGKAAKIINCSPQHVNRWMKKNMLDFYNKNCFRRQ
jgi:very-short-patch-repair endonuclease